MRSYDKTSVRLTHWGRETHPCVGKLTIIASDNGLSHGRRQAIIWTNAWLLLIGPLETDFSEILIEFHTFSFKKMHLKMSSRKWRPFCLGLNVLIDRGQWNYNSASPAKLCIQLESLENHFTHNTHIQLCPRFENSTQHCITLICARLPSVKETIQYVF